MIYKIILLLGVLAAMLLVGCNWDSHTEPEINVNNAEILGQAMFVNVDPLKSYGISELNINEGDTVMIEMSTALLLEPNYSYTPEDAAVVKIVKDPTNKMRAFAIAQADSGGTTTLKIVDSGNGGAARTINVSINKQWADPDFFTSVGSFGGHTYYLSNFERGWIEAEKICRDHGGYMTAITTAEENTFLDEARGNVENVWIGIRLNNVGGDYKITTWANGEAVELRLFNSTSAGIFAEYYYHFDINGKWENWHERTFLFLLEME